MKRKVNKKNYTEVDNFERKQKKHPEKRDKSSKRRLSIYDEFDDEDLDDYASNYEDLDEDEDF
ncbi:hypothetical protein D1164_10225 [Mariniphaga sediminis]|jgi:parvulin-like peptidyl-prolyl isomerase|uniref:Uncharacterized protein n=1 Tax=Mariniphaga sediminis TaxID=1628158 RepID=A0A399D1Z4_9BACT|nr:hypothetical protein [Mariniphaga sediminis]RIH65486.1 hypothetical protein D1164_10225 [Mariniphaga sediminis]